MALMCALLYADFQVPRSEFNYVSFIIKLVFNSNFINLPRVIKKSNKIKFLFLVSIIYVELFLKNSRF